MKNIAILGASGAIGREFVQQLAAQSNVSQIAAFSRQALPLDHPKVSCHGIDFFDEQQLAASAMAASQQHYFDQVIIATGILHDADIKPEKSLADINERNFQHLFQINTTLPALALKHFLPRLRKDQKATCAVLSARVGSISDNHLGGWYAYRASKAALNMIIKCASIEVRRRNKNAVIVGLHPGTVDSQLSKPHQKNLKPDQLFTPTAAVSQMLNVMESLSSEESGKCFAYDGQEILA